ncbi:Pycsar system effector family protein [[Acholeplasma] multilocale]|uniref:Pycsar system effector family protein n=1 Tax=[Acholeplasma] multilocale TaxID=264638 RepID=UPI0003F68291|nr:Pycsar system effector family protein [[Acholeplasma] multilocale]
MQEKLEKVLASVQSQINKFDNKANILLVIVGIYYAIIGVFLGVTGKIGEIKNSDIKISLIVVLVITMILIFISTISSILCVMPRKRVDSKNKSQFYYYHIFKMKESEITGEVDIETLKEQIKINATICKGKHDYVLTSSISLLLATFMLIPLLILVVI